MKSETKIFSNHQLDKLTHSNSAASIYHDQDSISISSSLPCSESFILIDACWRVFSSVLSSFLFSNFSSGLGAILASAGKKLHKSVVQRQAIPDPEPSSLISFSIQSSVGLSGLVIVPRRTSFLKHSRTVAETRLDRDMTKNTNGHVKNKILHI